MDYNNISYLKLIDTDPVIFSHPYARIVQTHAQPTPISLPTPLVPGGNILHFRGNLYASPHPDRPLVGLTKHGLPKCYKSIFAANRYL